jgi:hypothetical protein
VQAHSDDPSKFSGLIGLRQILIENNYDATSVLGWKEQKVFGLKAEPFIHLPEGPRVSMTMPNSLSALQFLLIHEIAHILDFINSANDFDIPEAAHACTTNECYFEYLRDAKPRLGSWSELSWATALQPKMEQSFPLWSKLCFYNCSENLEPADIEEFYGQIAPTNFPSTYAAVSPYEDFAESFTFYVLSIT